jgi:hypothetical protein
MTMTATKPLVLELYNTDGPENPTEYMGWTVHTFGLGKITDTDRDEFVESYNRGTGEVHAVDKELAAKLTHKTAFWLSYYEHGEGALSLKGEGQQCQWDTTTLAGLLVWDGDMKALGRRPGKRAEAARDFLEIYNKWANGHVYSWSLEEDGENVDGCDECYDEEDMFTAIREAVKGRPVMLEGEAKWLARFYGEGLTVVDEDGDPVSLGTL